MTRHHGAVGSATGLGPFGHLGLGYQDRAEFLGRAAEYIADGLQRNQCIIYVGDRSRAALRAELAAMPGVADRMDSDSIRLTPVEDYYVFCPDTDIIDAEPAVAMYVNAVESAIANGYSGFRAVMDATPVARTSEQRDALATLEYLVDQEMAVRPFSSLCGYDTSQLGSAADELICLHPFVGGSGSVTFRLYAQPADGIDFALAGEIDAAGNQLFATTLRRMWPLFSGDTLCIDAQGLEFIGHEQLLMLDRRARQDNREIRLLTYQPVVTRLVELLDLTNVRLGTAPPDRARDDEFAQVRGDVEERVRQLESQPAIEQVRGMLMQSLCIDVQEAFAVLARFSQDTNTKLRDFAERIRGELTGHEETRRATIDALKAVRDRLWPSNRP